MNTNSYKHIEKYNQVRPYSDTLAFLRGVDPNRNVNPPIIIDTFSAFDKRLIHLYGFPKHVGHYTNISLNCLFSCDFLSITLDHWTINDFLKSIHH